MKTTIDIPEPLYRKAKIRAARTGTTLREIILTALEGRLNATAAAEEAPPVFKKNRLGFPILPSRQGVVVTNEMVNRIREEEGI